MYSYKDIWRLSTPIMLGLLAQNIVQFTATVFLGYVGKVEQGAVGLAGIYYIAFFTLCFGFSIGGQIMMSRRNGEKNYDKIGTIVIQGIIFLELLAILLFILNTITTQYLVPRFLTSANVIEAVQTYMYWRIFGLFFSAINVMFRAFYVGIARTKVLTINAVIMSVVNLVFDYLLIFGKLGFPEMGIKGAGIAAVLAEMSSVLFFVIYTFKTVDLKKYGFIKMRFKLSVIRTILNISSFTMVQYLISMSTWFLFFVAMEKHSEESLAITNIVRSFYMIFFIPMNAFATAANTMVGNTMGAGRVKDVIPVIKRICLMSLGFISLTMLITGLMPETLISFVAPKGDYNLISQSIVPLMVVVFALPICSLATVVFNSISGTGNTRDALIIEAVALVGYVIYLVTVAFDVTNSVAVCWLIEYIYWGSLLLFSILYLRFAKWQFKIV